MEFLGWGGSLVFTFMFAIHIARMKNRVTTVLLPDATYFSLAVRIYWACVSATQKISRYCYDCNADLKLVGIK